LLIDLARQPHDAADSCAIPATRMSTSAFSTNAPDIAIDRMQAVCPSAPGAPCRAQSDTASCCGRATPELGDELAQSPLYDRQRHVTRRQRAARADCEDIPRERRQRIALAGRERVLERSAAFAMHDELAGELPRAFFADRIGATRTARDGRVASTGANRHLLFQLRCRLPALRRCRRDFELRQNPAISRAPREVVNGIASGPAAITRLRLADDGERQQMAQRRQPFAERVALTDECDASSASAASPIIRTIDVFSFCVCLLC